MGQVRHGSATTTYAVRAAIQQSQAPLAQLSQELGINPKTVAKWRKRATVEDLKAGPKEPRSKVLTTIRTGDDTFDTRADLPEAWAGLTDAALEGASGVPGAKFCHNGRFIAVASKRDAIFQMADLAIAEVA